MTIARRVFLVGIALVSFGLGIAVDAVLDPTTPEYVLTKEH